MKVDYDGPSPQHRALRPDRDIEAHLLRLCQEIKTDGWLHLFTGDKSPSLKLYEKLVPLSTKLKAHILLDKPKTEAELMGLILRDKMLCSSL